MPHSTGDGYEAPGRALQQLGKGLQGLGSGIASLAGGLKSDADREQNLRDQLAALNFDTTLDQDEIRARETPPAIDDDGVANWTGYADRRAAAFDSKVPGFMQSVSPQNQLRMQVFLARKRGSLVEGAMRYEQGRRHESLFAKGDHAIGGEFAKLSTVDPNTFDSAFEETMSRVDRVIQSMPPNEAARRALRGRAIEQAVRTLQGLGAGKEYPALRQYIERWSGKPIDADAENDPVAQGTAPGAPAAQPGPVSFVAPPLQRTVGRSRQAGQIRGIVMHQTWGSDTMEGNGSWSNKTGTGAHFYIAKDGKVFQWADPETVAMAHAGKGRGVGGDKRPDLTNDNTIGIEIMTRPNERPNATQIAVARQLGLQLLEKYRLTPQDVMGHGELAPGHRMANEAIEAVEAIRNGGTQTAGGLKVQLSAYAPKQGGDRMEGGYASSRPGPDGKAEVRTLEDVASGRSPYVTLAGNPSHYGKSYTIPSIAFIGTDGKTQTLTNVRGVVHDTGSAFKSAPEGRFDVPVARDADAKTMAANHAAWKKAGVEFVPASSEAKPAPPPVAERGLTRYAGLTPPSKTDATDDGNDPVAQGTAPGQISDTPRGDNAIPGAQGEQQLAQAGAPLGRPTDATRAQMLRALTNALPAARARHAALVEQMVKRAEQTAVEGLALPDAEMAALRDAVAGMRDPVLSARAGQIEARLAYMQTLRQATPEQLNNLIMQQRAAMAASGKGTPEALAHVEMIEKLRDKTKAQLEKDPVGMAVARGLVPAQREIDPARVSVDEIMNRQVIAAGIAARYGIEPKFFTSAERERIGEFVRQGGKPLIGVMGIIVEGMGANAPRALAEISNISPEAATVGYLAMVKAEPSIIKDIADGVALKMQMGKEFKPIGPSQDNARTAVLAVTNGALGSLPQAEQRLIAAALTAYEIRARRAGKDPKAPDMDMFKKAVEQVLGTNIVGGKTYGGIAYQRVGYVGSNAVVLPENVRSDALPTILNALRKSDVMRPASPAQGAAAAAGREPQPGMVESFMTGKDARDDQAAPSLLGPVDRNGRPMSMAAIRGSYLVTIGPGRYHLAQNDPKSGDPQWVGDLSQPDGLFVLDFNRLMPVLKARGLSDVFRPE